MPIRSTRPRKNEGLRKHIIPLYASHVLKFLDDEERAPVKALIFGPDHKPTGEDSKALREIWQELRDDILEAQARYQPDKKPWGCRFDRKREAKRQ